MYMFTKIWKIGFALLMAVVVVLIIRDSQGFDWKEFNYKKDKIILETIDIGFIGSLTGPNSLTGVQSLAAAQLAVDDINAAGGVDGKTVRLFAEDGMCSREVSRTATEKLRSRGVQAIAGGMCSSESLGIVDGLGNSNIPVISYCSSATELSGIHDSFFRVYPSNIFQGVYAADYIKNSLDIRNVAVVYENDPWGSSLSEVFTASFEGQNGVVNDTYVIGHDTGFEDMWTEIRESNVELVYFLGRDLITLQAFGELEEQEDFILFGADVWDNADLWNGLSLPLFDIYFSVVDTRDYKATFFDNIKERGIYHTGSCLPQAYDAVRILANTFDPELTLGQDVITYLNELNYAKGVSNRLINFNEQGDIQRVGYVIRKVEKKEM